MNAAAEDPRSLPGWSRQIPTRPLSAGTRARRAEPERQTKLPGGGLAGAAEDPALLLYAGLRREPPDRPPPGVPHGGFDRTGLIKGEPDLPQ